MKTLFLSVAVLALTSTAAMAEHHEGHKKKMDKDGDGAISKSEYMDMQEKRFQMMDANGDGKIERAEFKKARENWKEKRKEMREKRKEYRDKKQQDAE